MTEIIEFVRNNILMVLTLLGAIISFGATFIGIVSKKPPVSILAGLAVLGFTVGIAYQFYNYNEEAARQQVEAMAERARTLMMEQINETVQATKLTVDSIAEQINHLGLQDVGTELVNIKFTDDIERSRLRELHKGPPELWPKYAARLTSFTQESAEPSLSLTLKVDHQYNTGLLLAYLLTSNPTMDHLKGVVEKRDEWNSFSAEDDYVKTFASDVVHIEWVLFYDGTTNQPVAYAPAQAFTQELMVYHRLKEHDKIASLLNAKGPNTIANLRKSFPSIQTSVFETESPAELVKLMINQQLAISLTSAGDKPYVAKLERMIQLAASEAG